MRKNSSKPMRIVVVGAGLMGRGIGQSFAVGGHQVTLVDLDNKILKQAVAKIKESLSFMKTEGLLKESPEEVTDRISLETDVGNAVSRADYVEEAIFEDLNAKKMVFAKMDSANHDCILASNTSGLPITVLASVTTNPERVVGAHFWNPPYLMQAVEVVRGEETSSETMEKTVALLKGIGKKPAVVQKDVPGQIGIRILYAMIREATWLVENGVATPEDIDSVVREAIGTRLEVLGPLELSDLSGVDLVNAVARNVYKSLDSSKESQRLVKEMVARGDVGIKSGKGFYDWKGKEGRDPDSVIKMRDEHLVTLMQRKQ